MGTQVSKMSNREQERLERIDELKVAQGSNWAAQFKPGSFGCHELLDRTNLAADIVEEYVLSHPACIRDREWYALADKAVTALRDLYQRIGAKDVNDTQGG
jgi:hypothetical protein